MRDRRPGALARRSERPRFAVDSEPSLTVGVVARYFQRHNFTPCRGLGRKLPTEVFACDSETTESFLLLLSLACLHCQDQRLARHDEGLYSDKEDPFYRMLN